METTQQEEARHITEENGQLFFEFWNTQILKTCIGSHLIYAKEF